MDFGLSLHDFTDIQVGDVIQVQSSSSAARGEEMSNFCFVVGPDEAGRHGALQVGRIVLSSH